LKPVYGKTTIEGVVCGIADILVATLAMTNRDGELDGYAIRDVTTVGKLDSGRQATNLKA
jgi:hypothetical protein